MTNKIKTFMTAVFCAAALFGTVPSASAMEKTQFKVMWSIYVGWMPWGYAADAGIVDKWADKYGIEIEVVQFNDYIESINQYTAGAFDAGVMTNMDALTIPAVGGVDTTAVILGDFSNGNDGVVIKGGSSVRDLKGRNVNLVELSVSHYLLARALDSVGMSERDLTVVNTSDADIVGVFSGTDDVDAVVTWNPQLSEVVAVDGATKVFDSADIPGEIIDMLVVNTATLEANPKFAKALVGAWFETMAVMSGDDAAGKAARSAMAKAAGTDLAGYEAQLATTKMFYEPSQSVSFAKGPSLSETMAYVARFSFDHGLLGEGAADAKAVGIEYPDGTIFGDPANVKLRFDPSFMKMAAEGAL